MVSTKSNKVVKYSAADITLLGLLPNGRPISSAELADKYYSLQQTRPRFPRQSIVSMMSCLIADVELNKEPFRIVKAKRSGPNPMEYRKVKR